MEIQIKSDSGKGSKVITSLMENVPEKGFILDAGCGNFYYANAIRSTSREIICLDIVRPEKDLIKNNMFFNGSIERLPFKNDSFDFIYCFSVIQFIDNDRAVIEEFYRVLKPGGRLLLTIPTRNSPFRIIRDLEICSGVYKFPQFNVNHHHYYSIEDIYNLIFNTFKLESITGYQYNFIPRLFNLLLDMSNQRNGCQNVSKYFSKKNKNSYGRHWDQSQNRSISNIIYGFAYHYIVLLVK